MLIIQKHCNIKEFKKINPAKAGFGKNVQLELFK